MPAGEARLPGVAEQSATTDSVIAVSSGEVGPSCPRAKSWNSARIAAGVVLAGEAQPPGIAKQSATTKPELAESSGEAGSLLCRAGGTTNIAAAAAVTNSADEARPPGFAKHSATTESGVGVPKVSCQGMVEVVKNILQERDSERKADQSGVKGGPMISCWDVGKIVKSFDARPPQFLDSVCKVWVRGGRRCMHEVALCDSGARQFFLRSHRRTSAGEFSLVSRCHVACVSKLG